MTKEFHKIWLEQCDAAEGIDVDFGRQKAIRYLVGEKFVAFLSAAERNADFAAEIHAFAARVRGLFEPYEITAELDRVQVRDCTGDESRLGHDGDDLDPGDEPEEVFGDDVVLAAERLMVVERARELLLGETV